MPRPFPAAAIAALICAGCGAAAPPANQQAPQAQAAPLVGTTWRLQAIESMDDARGAVTPQPQRVYTMRLDADGRAAFQLDCNRGTGTYTTQAGEPGRGALAFGNVGMTRAMCPPDSLDGRIARDMAFVRTYAIQGETLTLGMMADGGVYRWRREAGAAAP